MREEARVKSWKDLEDEKKGEDDDFATKAVAPDRKSGNENMLQDLMDQDENEQKMN